MRVSGAFPPMTDGSGGVGDFQSATIRRVAGVRQKTSRNETHADCARGGDDRARGGGAQKWSAQRCGNAHTIHVHTHRRIDKQRCIERGTYLSSLPDAYINSRHLRITAARCRIDATIPPNRRYHPPSPPPVFPFLRPHDRTDFCRHCSVKRATFLPSNRFFLRISRIYIGRF